MNKSSDPPRAARFATFEVDFRARELRKHGLKIKLQEKPFKILAILLEHAGEVVTREELHQKLWPADTFVDFDHGLNAGINKLREALSDSADNPRFVETLARRGYRFIAPVEGIGGALRSRKNRATAPPPAAEAIDSLAVLPFENTGADPEIEYLSEGLTEGVIFSLAQLPQLRVMARSTVWRYRDRKVDPQTAGAELGVRAVLTGRVVQRADTLVVGAELVDVSNGLQLWGQQYSRKLSDLLAMQEQITQEISEKLRSRLTGEEKKRLARRYTDSSDAYQAYLKGCYHGNQRTEEGLRKGIEYFEKAIQTDPDYALAYAGLADCYSILGVYALLPPRELVPKMKEAANRALEINDRLAEAHTALAVAGLFYDWDWTGAEGELRRAIELNPNLASAHYWYGIYLESMGLQDQALIEIQRALELDPYSLIISSAVGLHYYFARQYDKAVEKCRQTLPAGPKFYLTHCIVGLAYEQMGKMANAVEEFQMALYLSAGAPPATAMLAHTYALSGRKAEARELLEKLKELSQRHYVPPVRIAILHLGLKEKEAALEWLEKAYQERSNWLLFLNVDPLFDDLRAEPRFHDLLRRMGLGP